MQPLTNMTVLVAEDERSVRMLLRVVLEAAGARVLEADDGIQALRLLELHADVDVLCTDVNMPNLDGPGLVDAARMRRPDLPVVVCSALDLRGHAAPLAGLADAHVQKPFVPSDLVRAISGSYPRPARRDSVAAS
ncbi:MAG: response regulator receiver protein [Thermoleophilia bacterium]|nr:response regulator receiver protein [Thermoleophilia bacterium]